MADEPPVKKNKTNHLSNNKGEERINWRKWKEQKKEEKRQRKESKLIQQLEKQQQKKEEENEQQVQQEQRESKGRLYTLSVALPGSVMDNAQSPELRTYLAGQIARACGVFCVDEVVIFDELREDVKSVEGEFRGIGKKGQGCVQLARILQYLECPQYLRKSFFPKHQDLQFAGLLNPLDSPHHMRIDEEVEFREGVVLNQPSKPGKGSFVNCGMRKEVQIDKQLKAGLRVTVQLNKSQNKEVKVYKGVVVAPHVPRTEGGLYWGYSVRLASCLSAVFTECPYKDGYDLTIGTSERGKNADHVTLPPFKRMLVVFGGLQGLEASVDADENLNITDPSVLFDLYLNTCPGQGSRTIRTEEAILISLSGLRQKIAAVFPDQSKG
ncbi:putative methyltransferase C9orf114 [Sinocyclocheilus anshuiensis]|uniref:28S rRNA (uridine-N(3))-methyltransferase n=1 Tax=Sinocyclocheilus anshuiensis TaxID=1608454 RepID=A0A671PWR6_9TELE|nr:PREDICTED: putative methyltransferase C9orf114 [Sinocyclocheilus anshuiensis]